MSERQENYGTTENQRREWAALSLDAREIAEAVLDNLEERYFDFALLFDELRRKSEFYDMRSGIGKTIDEKLKEMEG